MSTPAKPRAKRSNLTKAELEAMVKELRAALEEAQNQENKFANLKDSLEEAHQNEDSLKQEIADLKSNLQKQEQFIEKLQNELEGIKPLKAEFEEAKKAAVHLAATNEKLTEEVKALKKENEDLKSQRQNEEVKVQRQIVHEPMPRRPIQKETEKPADFAKNTWLL